VSVTLWLAAVDLTEAAAENLTPEHGRLGRCGGERNGWITALYERERRPGVKRC
jgi:hypothetical protein